MTRAIAPWPRPLLQPGGKPNVFHLFCFAPGPLSADVPLSALRFGIPDSSPIEGGVAHFSAFGPATLHLNNEALLVKTSEVSLANRLDTSGLSRSPTSN
jgi:hypothetical protein